VCAFFICLLFSLPFFFPVSVFSTVITITMDLSAILMSDPTFGAHETHSHVHHHHSVSDHHHPQNVTSSPCGSTTASETTTSPRDVDLPMRMSTPSLSDDACNSSSFSHYSHSMSLFSGITESGMLVNSQFSVGAPAQVLEDSDQLNEQFESRIHANDDSPRLACGPHTPTNAADAVLLLLDGDDEDINLGMFGPGPESDSDVTVAVAATAATTATVDQDQDQDQDLNQSQNDYDDEQSFPSTRPATSASVASRDSVPVAISGSTIEPTFIANPEPSNMSTTSSSLSTTQCHTDHRLSLSSLFGPNTDRSSTDEIDHVIINGKYRIDPSQVLGRGTFATVYLGHRISDGVSVAVKCIVKSMVCSHSEQLAIAQEVRLLRELAGTAGVVSLFDAYETPKRIWMFMERHESTLYKLMNDCQEKKTLSEATTKAIATRILGVLKNMHARSMLHCDIKPGNILVDSNNLGLCTLIDFGVCVSMDPSTQAAHNNGVRGTSSYIAPEIRSGYDYTPAADIYSLGVTAYEMLVGHRVSRPKSLRRPYGVTCISAISDLDDEKLDNFTVQFGSSRNMLSKEACEFVSQMLHPDPNRRASVKQLLAHPWLSQEKIHQPTSN
jgi:Protein kinase domain